MDHSSKGAQGNVNGLWQTPGYVWALETMKRELKEKEQMFG